MARWFPGRRLSWVRLGILVLVIAALVGGSFYGWGIWQDQRTADSREPWSDGYVDVTATPTYAFENPRDDGTNNIVLAFIVASEHDACEPSWGGFYSLDQAAASLDLDRRLARFRVLGGSAMVSFGGQANFDLAFECEDHEKLKRGYESVVERYEVSSIDMDIEGALLADGEAVERQAQVIAQLQEQRSEDGGLDVWLTLPVASDGLTADGLRAVRAYLGAGVSLAGVNAMTMNYGIETNDDLGATVLDSLSATQKQMRAVYQEIGSPIGDATAWSRVSATPMIGQNDVRGEVFTLDDAEELNQFAAEKGMARLSMWSINRDRQCDDLWPDPQLVSDSCSGVDQGSVTFAEVLGAGRHGLIGQIAEAMPAPVDPEDLVDDPETSPYPIWNSDAAYPAETKVVWRRNVYEAKWWTQGDQPDEPSQSGDAHPWRLIGPVLPGETPIERPQLPDEAYATWEKATEYRRGDRVVFDGQGYEAKWWTQGDSPDAALVLPQDSPWRQLTDDEISEVIAEHAGT